jgi:hypothetical protein
MHSIPLTESAAPTGTFVLVTIYGHSSLGAISQFQPATLSAMIFLTASSRT